MATSPARIPFQQGRVFAREGRTDWGILPRKESKYDDVVIVDYAIDFLESHSGDPFFLSVGTFHPHLPWYIPKALSRSLR